MNENENVSSTFNEDSEDDENQEYFLQATSNAYDIKEKIRAANNELFESYESYNNVTREQKVTFRENLVDYEPDYSSDDGYVQSPEALTISDNESDTQQEYYHQYHPLASVPELPAQDEEEYIDANDFQKQYEVQINTKIVEEQQIIETNFSKPQIVITENNEACASTLKIDINNQFKLKSLNSFKCADYPGISEQVEEDIDEEFITEEVEIIEITDDVTDTDNDLNETEIINIEEETPRTPINQEEASVKRSKNKTNKKQNKHVRTEPINCRLHCLEKKDLDIISESMKHIMNVNKGPALKLRPRVCCENQQYKPKLPIYNGFISEYGMTRAQIDRRQKWKEKNVQKSKEKLVKIREEKVQKDLYNEEIFCAWLRSVRQRNHSAKENIRNKNNSSPSQKQRPKTADDIYKNTNNKKYKIKRPNTSPSKGYITTIYVSPGVKVKEILHFNH